MYYHSIYQICTNSQSDIFFTLISAPRIYFTKKISDPQTGERLSRDRVSGVEDAHEAFAGFSLIYKVTLTNQTDHPKVVRLGKKAGIPPINPKTVVSEPASTHFVLAFTRLVGALQDHQLFPFRPAFQLNALVSNGIVPPETVIKLLPRVRMLILEVGEILAGGMLERFGQDLIHGSEGRPILEILEERIARMRTILTPQYFEDQKKNHTHMAFIHRMMITPTGVFSYGPNWEASNRVLRQYSDYHDYFLRVSFCEEDGEQFQNEPRVNARRILTDQFLNRLDPAPPRKGALVIAGRRFEFLGFSNSSLKSQTCWYMAPFEIEGRRMDAGTVVRSLGDFSQIRTPGRYAARVGQAFSDTIGSVLVDAENEVRISDIERNDSTGKLRNFSDGIGKVSGKMVERIWETSETIGKAMPTVFQIRYAGAKGMIALDPTLKGDKLCLRKSMIKFEGSEARNIELCTWASRLPMFLNRPLIKVLEDLGVKDNTFLQLQNDAVERLRDSSKSAALAANFLRRRGVSSSCLRLPWLFEGLKNVGMDFWDDQFLERALELSLLMDLRDIKYRGRIPVKYGVTLIGVLDETKYLEEGEIYVNTEDEDGKPERIEGRVLITRSPVHHPGDVQMVNAVNVPSTSPLRPLRNAVVFSQKGDRPLPSMLAGGDLDGDLYNIIYDSRFCLSKNENPAEYPSVKPIELPHPIEATDVANFFVDFIENNLLGLISNRHLVIADQKKEGVFHPDCLKLAEMASTAVDFPKTGHKVNRKDFPHASLAKPDFLAPGPRVLVSKNKLLHEQREDDDDVEHLIVQSWYLSEKILGKLYRAINEDQFLEDIRHSIRLESRPRPKSLLERLYNFVQLQMSAAGIPLKSVDWIEFAEDLRISLCGTIIGGRDKQTKRQRDLSSNMKDEFNGLAEYTVDLLKGETREDTLNKCMACLKICLPNRSDSDKRSFGWVASSVLMSEVDTLQKEQRRSERLRQLHSRRTAR
ncbi:RNA dependent RNA polymerase-domain-containing protein [Trichophaea hybrida]|nr:RNA dependent RNA polymerase-domain-containing protein [Trichophaea hybrida]